MTYYREVVLFFPLLLLPMVLEMGITQLKRRQRYRFADALTNVMLALLTVMGSAAVVGITLAIYERIYAHALFAPPALVAWPLAFVLYDLLYYWTHRLHHRIAALWGVHVVHHSGEDMNFSLAVRQSAFGDATMWVFFLPMAFLGISPEIYLAVVAVQLVYQYSLHNAHVPALGWLEKVLVTPSQHRVHHSRNRRYIDKNYGNVLVLWDRIFGSYQPELAGVPPVYGLRKSPRTHDPVSLHFATFRDIWRKASRCRSWIDRLLCLLKPPGWRPASMAGGGSAEDDGPSVSFRKYDVQPHAFVKAYTIVQLVAMAAALAHVLWYFDALARSQIAVVFGLVVLSAWTVGRMLDNKPYALASDAVRLAVVACAAGLLATEAWEATLAVYSLACLVCLGAFRLARPERLPC